MMKEILRYGSQVRISNIDAWGFCGRDRHPGPHDVGFAGIVVGNLVTRYDPGIGDVDFPEPKENVLGGTEYDDDEEIAMYLVRSADGRELDCMDFELEDLS